MTYPQVWSNGKVRALPVGRLPRRTLLNVGLGRSVSFRAGPWVPVEEDESRLVRIMGSEVAKNTNSISEPAPPAFERFEELLFTEVLPVPVESPGPAARSA